MSYLDTPTPYLHPPLGTAAENPLVLSPRGHLRRLATSLEVLEAWN